MKVDTSTVSTFEAAMLLWAGLGDLRGNWSDFLSDCNRAKTSIGGITLLPCLQKHDGRLDRPRYSVSGIKEFIAAIKAAIPSAGKTRITPITLSIDTCKTWKQNKFDRHGLPVL